MRDYKRITSFFLALAILLGTVLQPFPAFAMEGNSEEEEVPYTIEIQDDIPYQVYKYKDVVNLEKPRISFFAVGDPIPEYERYPVNVVWTTYDFKPTDLPFDLKFEIHDFESDKIIAETKTITERGLYYFYQNEYWDDEDVSHNPYDWELWTPLAYSFDIRLNTSQGGVFEDGDIQVTISQKASSIYKAEYYTNAMQNPVFQVKRQDKGERQAIVPINSENLGEFEYYSFAEEKGAHYYYDNHKLIIKNFDRDTSDNLRISDYLTASRVMMFLVNPETQEVNRSGEFTDTANGGIKYVYNVTGNYRTDHIISVRQKLAVKFDENGGTWKTEKPNTQYIGHSLKIGEEFGPLSKVVVPDGTNDLIPPPVGDGGTNSFKGWNTDKNATEGMDLSEYEVKDNVTFYAIYDEQGEGKAQVKYVDNNGQPIELTEDNKITGQDYIVETTGELNTPIAQDIFTAETAPKILGYKFNRVELSPENANYTADGKSIIKIYYDKVNDVIPGTDPESQQPNNKPEGYVTVDFNLDGKGSTTDETIYYVNPNATGLTGVKAPNIKANTGYKFKNWDPAVKTSYTTDTTHTAKYEEIEDVVPGNNGEAEKPDGYVTVNFDLDGKGTTEEETVFYVNPNATGLTGVKAPNVTANTGYKFNSWDSEVQAAYTQDTTHKALYDTIENIIPGTDPDTGENSEQPAGYVEVKFDLDGKGTTEDETTFYVNPEAGIKLVDITKPEVTPNTGYKYLGWDKTDREVIGADGLIVTAQYEEISEVIPGTNPETQQPNEKPDGYVTVNFDLDGKGTTEDETVFYVNPNATDITGVKAPNVTANTGYKFKNWDPTVKTSYNTDITHTAKYEEIKDLVPGNNGEAEKPAGYVTVKLDLDGKGTTEDETIFYVNPEKEVTLTAPSVKAKSPYDFANWSEDLTGIFDKDTTIYAQYKLEIGTIKGASITPSSQTIAEGAKIENITITPEDVDAIVTVENLAEALNYNEETKTITGTPVIKDWKDEETQRDIKIPITVTNPDESKKTEYATIRVTKAKDAVSQRPGQEKPTVPESYVKVEFKQGKNGEISQGETTIYWVNPNSEVSLTAPDLTANIGYSHSGWSYILAGQEKSTTNKTRVTDKFTEDTLITALYTKTICLNPEVLKDQFEKAANPMFDKIAKKEGGYVGQFDEENHQITVAIIDKEALIKDFKGTGLFVGLTDLYKNHELVKLQIGENDVIDLDAVYQYVANLDPQPEDIDNAFMTSLALTVQDHIGNILKDGKALDLDTDTMEIFIDKEVSLKLTVQEEDCDNAVDVVYSIKGVEAAQSVLNGKLEAKDLAVWQNTDPKSIDWSKGLGLSEVTEDQQASLQKLLDEASVTDASGRNTTEAGKFPGTLNILFADGSELNIENQNLIVRAIKEEITSENQDTPVPEDGVIVEFIAGEGIEEIVVDSTTDPATSSNILKTMLVKSGEKLDRADFPEATIKDGFKAPITWTPEDLVVTESNKTFIAKATEKSTADKINDLGGLSPETITVWVGEDIDWKQGVKATDEANVEVINALLNSEKTAVTDKSNRDSAKAGSFAGALEVQFEDGSIVTVNNHLLVVKRADDVVPQTGEEKPDVPDKFVKVEFLEGDHGSLTGTTIYWVNPEAEVTLTEPTVKSDTGFMFTKWDKALTGRFAEATDIIAQYKALDDVVEGTGNEKPDGYFTVSFDLDGKGTTTDEITFYVNPEKEVTLTAPAVEGKDNWTQKEGNEAWDPEFISTKQYTADFKYIAQYNYSKNVVPQIGTDKPDVPDNFVKVSFKAGTEGVIANDQAYIYWVNPEKEVTIPAPKVTVTKADFAHSGWKYTLANDPENPVDKTTDETAEVKDTFKVETEITAIYMKTTCMTPDALREQFEAAANAKFENIGEKKDIYVGKYDAKNHKVTVAIMDKTQGFASLSGTGLVAGLTDLFENNSLAKFKIGNQDERDLNAIWQASNNNKKTFQENVAQLVGMDMANALDVQNIENLGDFVDKQVTLKLTVEEIDCNNGSTIDYTIEGKEAISSLLGGKIQAQDIAVWIGDEIAWENGVKLVDDASDEDKANFAKIREVKDATEPARTSQEAGKHQGNLLVSFEDGSYTTVADQMLYVSERKVSNPTDEDKLPDDAITVNFVVGEGIAELANKVVKVAPNTKLDRADFPEATIKDGFKAPVTWTPEDLVVTESNKTFTAKATGKSSADKIDELGGLSPVDITVWINETINWKQGVKATDEANAEAINALLNSEKTTVTDKSNRDSAKAGSFAGTLEVKFEDGSIVTVNNQLLVVKKTDDVVPQTGEEKPDVPSGFVKVEFLAGDNGSLTGTSTYWVNPAKEVTINAPGVKAKDNWMHTGWTMNPSNENTEVADDLASIKAQFVDETTITANYMEKVLTEEPAENAERYAIVEFLADDQDPARGTLEGTTKFWVLKNTEVKITEPKVTPIAEYKFTGWDNPISNIYSQDLAYTAQYQADPKIIVDSTTAEPLPGYVRLTFNATIDGRLGNAEGKQTKVLDVKKDTAYADEDLERAISDIKPVPVKTENDALVIDNEKVFDKWSPLVPTTGYVKTQEFTATYKVKEAETARAVIESEQRYDDSTDRQYVWGKIELAGGETAPLGTRVSMVDAEGTQIATSKIVYVNEDGTFEINLAGTNLKDGDTVYFVASEPNRADSEKGAELVLDLKGPNLDAIKVEADGFGYKVRITGKATDESGVLRIYAEEDKENGKVNENPEVIKGETELDVGEIYYIIDRAEKLTIRAMDKYGNKSEKINNFAPKEKVQVKVQRPRSGDTSLFILTEANAEISINISKTDGSEYQIARIQNKDAYEEYKLIDAQGDPITLSSKDIVRVVVTADGKDKEVINLRTR